VTMKYHDQFEWDPGKAKANQKKHGVTFELAAKVLADPQAEIYHLKICWTDRSRKGKQTTRIISACKAERRERILYEKAITKGK